MRNASFTVPSGTTPERHAQLGHERQPLPVVAAVGGQAVLEGGPDVQLAVGAAVLKQPVQLFAVALYVRVGRHV